MKRQDFEEVKAKSSQDTLNFPTMLNAKLSFLATLAGNSESGLTRAQEQLCEDLAAQVESRCTRWTPCWPRTCRPSTESCATPTCRRSSCLIGSKALF